MAKSSEYRNGYAAGYNAGARDRPHRFDRFYAAAITGLLACGGWRRGDKPDSSADDYADTARQIAEAMMRAKP